MATPSTKTVAEEAAEKAVRETFLLLGVNVDDHASVESFREDMSFSRGMRKRAEQGVDVFFKLIFASIATAVISAVWKYLHPGTHS